MPAARLVASESSRCDGRVVRDGVERVSVRCCGRLAPRRRRLFALLAAIVVCTHQAVLAGASEPPAGGDTAGIDTAGIDTAVVGSAVADPAALDLTAVDAFVTEQMRAARVPGAALAIVRDGVIVHARGYGTADPAGHPVTARTPFVIGSLSKSFTALAVMQLEEAGAVELDAPVQRYLPWFRLADRDVSARVTLRHLLHHTSAIPTAAGLRSVAAAGDVSIEQGARALADVQVQREPGAAFEYSNANYDVLGAVVEAVSGQPYDAYVRERIFAPLGMRDSFANPEEARVAGLSTGHRTWFGRAVPAALSYPRSAVPSGFLVASAEDMGHYLNAHLQGRRARDVAVLEPAVVAALHHPAVETAVGTWYAMGWEVRELAGVPVSVHSGATMDFNARMVIAMDAGWGVVVLANVSSMLHAPALVIADGVATILAGGDPGRERPGFAATYLVLNLVVLLVSALVVRSLVLLQRWRRRLVERPARGSAWLWRVALPPAADVTWPLVVLLLVPAGAGFPLWPVMLRFQPDLFGWALVVALLTLAKGIVRTVMVVGVVRAGSST